MTEWKSTQPEKGTFNAVDSVIFAPESNAGGDHKAGVDKIQSCTCIYISPKDAKVRVWETIVILTIFISCVIEVWMATFSSRFLPMWVIAYFCDLIYLFDIIKQFLQAYEVNGVLIRNRETTLKIYGRRRFVLDLLSILPGAIVYPFVPANQAWDIMAKVRLNRIIRFHRISAFFNAREAELGSNTSQLRTIKYSIVCFLMTHCLSCGWYGMACGVTDRSDMIRTCLNDSWVYNFDIGVDPASASVDDMYALAFYFAVATVTSTGYGDISASTYPEKWFCIAGMLVGIAVFFGMLLGGMTSLLTNLGAQRAQFAHRLGTIQHHLREEETPVELMSTVIRFYEYIWYRKKGVSSEGMFDTLPITFQEEISIAINQQIIDKAPIFKDLDVGFIRQLSMKIKPTLCLPHQFLVNRGDIGQQMYYIHRGEVEILGEDDESVIAKLAKGRIIGEINLIHSLPRTASIRAATHCDLMVLERKDVHELLPHYADVAKKLHDIANARIFNAKPLHKSTKDGSGRKRRKASAKNKQMKAIMEDEGSEKYRSPSGLTTDHGVHSVMERRSSLMYDERQATIQHRHSVTNEDGLEIIDDKRMNAPSAMTPAVDREEEADDFAFMIEVHRPTLTRRCWDCVSDAFTTLTTTLINPKSKGYKNWEMVVVAVAFLIAAYNTFMACFAGFREDSGYGSPSFGYIVIAVGYVMDSILWADVVVNLRTAVYTPNGIMQSEKEIVINYAKNYMLVDVASIIPIEAICLAAQTTQQKWIMFAFLKLNRLIKVIKAAGHFQNLEASLDQDIVWIRLTKCIVYISLLSHCLACVWFLSGCSGDACRSMSWVTHIELFNTDGNVTIGRRYVQSLYWAAATMTSTGYGDISAHTTLGRIVCIMAMLIGLLLYGYCLSIIAATLANADSAKVTYQAKLFAVKEFMTENKLNELVREKVIECLVRQFATTHGEFVPGGRPLLYDVPFGLQLDIANKDAMDFVGRIPLFRDLEERFLRNLTLKAKTYLFTPGDIIIYSGEIGREMYIIKKGYCEVLSSDLKTRYAEIGPGQYFGELGVIFSRKRTASIRAVTYCCALMITRDDLEELFIDYPTIRKEFDGLTAGDNNYENQLLNKLETREHRVAEKSVSVVHSIMDVIESDEGVKGQKTEQDALDDESKSKLKESIKMFHKKENGVLNKEYLKPFSLLNLFQKILALLLLRWTFLPTGKWLEAWTVFRVLLAIVVTCTLPIHIAFLEQNIAMWVIMYIFDLICFLDIYINFHVAYYNENNLLITHPIATAEHYAKTNLFIDLLAVLPIELFLFAAYPTLETSSVQLFALARINRFIQVYRLPMAFNFLESKIEKETGTFRKIKFFFYTVIFLIILNCCLFMMACPPELFIADDVEYIETGSGHRCRAKSWIVLSSFDSGDNSTWLSRSGYDLSQADITTLFVISIYWSTATTVSVGYGDIHATAGIDIIEMVVALSAMIVGVVFFGYIIASVAASLANADAQRARFQKKLAMITKFLKDQQINDQLANRVISYYEYIWIRTKGVDPDTLFESLPLSLWADVTYSLYREIIGKVALFEGTEVSFMKMLSRCIKPVLYQKGDYVVRKFDIGSEMFFINRGVVDVVSEDGSIVFASMKAGAFFGEVALLFTCPRTASIRAQTNVDMFVLSKGDLDSVLKFYPEIKEQVYKVAEERRSAAAAREKKGLDKPKAKTIHKKPAHVTSNTDDKNRPETPKQGNKEENKEAKTTSVTVKGAGQESTGETGGKEESGSPAKEKADDANNTNQNAGDSDKKDPKEGEEEAEPKPGCCRRFLQRLDKMNRFTINPAGKFKQYFSICTTIAGMSIGWTIAFQAAFQDHHPAIMVINYLAEVIFLAQIYVNFHLSFRDKYGELVEDFNAVYMNYLKSPKGFALDFIATFPLDIFALAAPAGSQLKALSYLRITHLLHLYHPFKWLGRWEKELNADVLTVRLLRSVFELGLVLHYFGSIWYGISCPGNVCLSTQTSHTWTSSIAADYHLRDSSMKYCDTLYWAVATMTSTGYGDISAHSVIEMLYASLVMICGKLLFGFVLGNIASTLSNEEAQRTEYDNKLSAITSHLVDQEVPTALKQRVVSYFDYLWIRNQGVDPKGLFKDAPYCMIAELTLEMSSDMFTKISLLDTAEDAFFRLLTEKINTALYMPGDNIIKKGDIISGLFYVYKGEVEVQTSDGTCKTIKEKEIFGEENLLHETTSQVTASAKTHLDLFNLSKKDLDEVLENYPELRVEVNEIGHEIFGITFRHDE